MDNTVIVHLYLLGINFLASIIQCLTGFGDTIVVQICWFTATTLAPAIFNGTPLGPEPIRAMTLLLYVRVVVFAPVSAYLNFQSGIFSPSMVLAMTSISTICTAAGFYIFIKASEDALRVTLAVSSLTFAAFHAIALGWRCFVRHRRRLNLNHYRAGAASDTATYHKSAGPSLSHVTTPAPSVARSTEVDVAATPIFLSVISGSPFTLREAQPPSIVDPCSQFFSLPPLTPSKVSPLHTLTTTRVRVNRHLSPDGTILLSTNIGATVAAAVSGIVGALHGVGAPVYLIFSALLDVPSYMNQVNFSMQVIPNAVLRVLLAWWVSLFNSAEISFFILSLIGGYLGLVVGRKMGRNLGPRSCSVFALSLLLLTSLVMMTAKMWIIAIGIPLLTIFTLGVACYEDSKYHEILMKQKSMGQEFDELVTIESWGSQEPPPPVVTSQAVEMKEAAYSTYSNGVPHVMMLPSLRDNNSVVQRNHTSAVSLQHRGCLTQSIRSDGSSNTGTWSLSQKQSQGLTRVRRADLMRPPSLWGGENSNISSNTTNTTSASAATAIGTRDAIHTNDLVNQCSRFVAVQQDSRMQYEEKRQFVRDHDDELRYSVEPLSTVITAYREQN